MRLFQIKTNILLSLFGGGAGGLDSYRGVLDRCKTSPRPTYRYTRDLHSNPGKTTRKRHQRSRKVIPVIKQAFQVGDKVKLILDKETSPDNQYHGRTGIIKYIEFDDAGSVTGDTEHNFIYTVKLDNGGMPDIYSVTH